MIFRTIQTLGKCAISQNEVFELIRFLHPKNQFPYGLHILRCLTLWAKTSTSIGINMSIIDGQLGLGGGGLSGIGGGGSGNAGGRGAGGSDLKSGGGVGSGGGGGGGNSASMDLDTSPLVASSTAAFLNNPSLVSPAEYNLTDSAKLRRTSFITINQTVLNNMMRTIGTGALSQNAHQQAKYFFDFQQQNSVNFFLT